MQTLTLPMPPSLNSYYRHVGNMVKISAAGRQFREDVKREVETQQIMSVGTERIGLHVLMERADLRRADLDNFCGKALLDALEHAGVYDNDGQIDFIVMQRGEKRASARMTVGIAVLPARKVGWFEKVSGWMRELVSVDGFDGAVAA